MERKIFGAATKVKDAKSSEKKPSIDTQPPSAESSAVNKVEPKKPTVTPVPQPTTKEPPKPAKVEATKASKTTPVKEGSILHFLLIPNIS